MYLFGRELAALLLGQARCLQLLEALFYESETYTTSMSIRLQYVCCV